MAIAFLRPGSARVSSDRPRFRIWVRQDLATNSGSPESQFVVVIFRAAQWLHEWGRPHWLSTFLVRCYRALTYMILHIELPPDVTIGPGLRIYHPHVIVLNPGTVIGKNCVLRHMVTIGNTRPMEGRLDCPVLGDDVEIGSGAMILGPLKIGNGARIGAGAVVVKDVPDNGVVVGNPATLIRIGQPVDDQGGEGLALREP